MLAQLEKILKGDVLFLGIGNELRADDGFGAILARRIKDKVGFRVFEAGVSPENFLGKLIKEKPDTVLLVDAVDFGGDFAEIKLWDLKSVKTRVSFSTHNSSLSLICDFLKREFEVETYLLAMQPKEAGFGKKMSPEVEKKLNEMSSWFKERYPYEHKETVR